MWFKSKGVIRYDPVRLGLNSVDRNGRQNRDRWWVIVDVDPEICRYYRWWVMRKILNPLGFEKRKDAIKHGFHFIDHPSHGAHISVVRGEKPDDAHMYLWKKYDWQRVEFEYQHGPIQTTIDRDGQNNYWFVEVRSEFLKNIRLELGRPVNWNFHLTVGRIWHE